MEGALSFTVRTCAHHFPRSRPHGRSILLGRSAPRSRLNKTRYPRRRLIRSILRLVGRLLLPLLARLEIEGLERFPRGGPLIVVGNHTGALEVVLLTVYAPRIIEYLGSIDIPHEGSIAAFINSYSFIPVFRGKASRASLEAGLDVLRQEGVLGMFPEGGIWEPTIRKAQAGVAWLSCRADAPILPIGFGSTRGALSRMLRLGRPQLSMRVGDVMLPVQIAPGRARKPQLQEAADEIVDRVWELVPKHEQGDATPYSDETFVFTTNISNAQGQVVDIPDMLALVHGAALSKVIHRTTLFNNLLENLRLPVAPLAILHTLPELEALLDATGAILRYLESDNPYYFTYRYGPAEGSAMGRAIREFHDLVQWALEHNFTVQAQPIRRFRRTDTGELVELLIPQEEAKW